MIKSNFYSIFFIFGFVLINLNLTTALAQSNRVKYNQFSINSEAQKNDLKNKRNRVQKNKTNQSNIPQVTELDTTPAALTKNKKDDSIAKFSLALGLSYEQQAQAADDGSQAKGLGFVIVPKVKIGDFNLSATLTYAYNTVQPELSEFADGLISAGYKGWNLFPALKVSPKFFVELPFTKESRENRGIIYVANAGLNLSLDTKYLNIEKYALSYSIAYGYFSNEFTTRENGDPAVKYKIVQTVSTSYDFDPVSVGLKLLFASNYSYDDVVRNGFFHTQFIAFKHTEILSYSLYHYNAGPLFKGNNYENNLKAYDKDSSVIGTSIDISI